MNKRARTLLRYGLLFFAAFFSLVAFTQYRFVLSQLQRTVSAELRRAADQVQKELVVNGTWDLAGFRRALVEDPSNYLAVTKDGLMIDVEGLVPGFLPKVTPPKDLPLQRAVTLASAVGEEWHLFARPVQGGTVIVGEPTSTAEADVDRRLEDNAKRFGGTIEEAASLGERSIDGLVDYAVFDDAHHVRKAAGGIPLAMSAQEVAEKVRQGPRIILDGRPYYVTSTSVTAGSAELTATIIVLKDISLEEQMIHKAKIFNFGVAAVSWLMTGLVFGIYEYGQRGIRISCEEAYAREEGQTIEFKSSMRWDEQIQMKNKALEAAVVKTVAAFLNTEGGVLLIGVDDAKHVLGLEPDYKTLQEKPNKDGFELALQHLLSNAIGTDSCARYVRVGFCSMDGKEICVVSVDRSRKPVIIEEATPSGPRLTLYVRVGNQSKPLNLQEALEYSKERWGI